MAVYIFGFSAIYRSVSLSTFKLLFLRPTTAIMSEHVRDWLDSLWKYFYGQPTVDTIRSARDWMRDPPRHTDFLEALSKLSEISINVSLPFRIIIAWAGKEENEEDIVYIEALMPSDDDIFPSIHIIEEKFLERGKYKIACLLVRQEDYERLLVQQNYQLGLS